MSGENEKIKNRGVRKKISPQIFFPFPHKILQKIVLTYIFISHTKVSFLTQSFYSQNSHFLSISHTVSHIHTHNPASAYEQSPAQRRCRQGRAQPSTPLLLDLSTVNPYPSALSPSPQDPFSPSPFLPLPPPYAFIFPHHTHTHIHSDFAW